MRATTVAFLLTDAHVSSCTLTSVGGRTIGRVTSQKPLLVDLPPGTHVLRAMWFFTESDVDIHVREVERQEIRLAVVAGEMRVVA
ncbi:MAG: hypothetical protein H3C62_07375 [Gemmatimonadaceae bacterium]|nr:hypothetical protein [Gemmatimonadaceae bacterium]